MHAQGHRNVQVPYSGTQNTQATIPTCREAAVASADLATATEIALTAPELRTPYPAMTGLDGGMIMRASSLNRCSRENHVRRSTKR